MRFWSRLFPRRPSVPCVLFYRSFGAPCAQCNCYLKELAAEDQESDSAAVNRAIEREELPIG